MVEENIGKLIANLLNSTFNLFKAAISPAQYGICKRSNVSVILEQTLIQQVSAYTPHSEGENAIHEKYKG